MKSVLNIHWKDWCWSWNSNILATWCEELTHWKRPWCWERLKAGGEGDDRGWDGWMASLIWWTWVWVNSASWWWTGRPGVLRFMGSQRVEHDWATELNRVEALSAPHYGEAPFWFQCMGEKHNVFAFFLETDERGRDDNSIVPPDINTVVLVTVISTTNFNITSFHP